MDDPWPYILFAVAVWAGTAWLWPRRRKRAGGHLRVLPPLGRR